MKWSSGVVHACNKISFLHVAGEIQVNDVNENRLEYLSEKYGVQTTLDVNETVHEADLVILACKPQNLTYIAKSIKAPVTGACATTTFPLV
mgnify:CR=1 FL=1|jgi:pyrroline-5-carboxylate reductase